MEMITHKQIPNATKLTIEEIILVIIELELYPVNVAAIRVTTDE